MKRTRFLVAGVVWIGLLLGGLGCGGGSQNQLPSPEEAGNAKVEAMKRLADAMAKEADGLEARGALEDFRMTPLNAEKAPKQTEEVVEIYQKRIQGKYRGQVAQELQSVMASYLSRGKQGK